MHDAAHLGRRQPVVQRRDGRADPGGAEHHLEELGMVEVEVGDPLVLPDPEAQQGVRDPVAALVELAVGDRARRADQCGVVAAAGGELGEHLRQRRDLPHATVTPAWRISDSARRRRGRRDARAQRLQQPGGEAVADRVQGGGAHAVVGGEAAHVHVGDVVPAQPVGERRAVGRAPLEAGVRRGVLALEEHRVERLRVEVGVEAPPRRCRPRSAPARTGRSPARR